MENQPHTPLQPQVADQSVAERFGMQHGPGIPGVELLGDENKHLLSENLVVQRTTPQGEPEHFEDGWRLNGVIQDEKGQMFAHVQKPGQDTGDFHGAQIAESSKYVPLEKVMAANPVPERNIDTTPRNQLLERVKEDKNEVEQLGEPAVKDSVEVSEVSSQSPEPVQESKIPDAQEVFSSSQSLMDTLKDPAVPVEVKQSIRGVVNTWKEIERLEASSELWDTVVQPTIERMSQTAGQAEFVVSDITFQAEQLQRSLREIANAVHDGHPDGIAESVRRGDLGNKVDEFSTGLRRRLPAQDEANGASVRALLETEDADYQRRRLARADDREVTPEEADNILHKIGGIIPEAKNFADISKASTEEAEKIKKRFPDWQHRYSTVNEAITFAHRGAGLEAGNTRRVLNELEMIVDGSRQGRYDSDQLEYAYRSLAPLLEDLDTVRRFMHTAQTYAQESER